MKLPGCLLFPLLAAGSGFDVYIGDSNPYRATAMTVDSAGNTYITGGRVFGDLLDVFVTKLDPSGNVLFTTTTGGKGSDAATSIAVDPNGNIWVGGNTTSPDFPLVNAVQRQPSIIGTTGFVLELAPAGGPVVFSSYFGGTLGGSSVSGIAVDSSGSAYVTGVTKSPDFPVTPGMPASSALSPLDLGGVSGAFIAKISASGGKILYSGVVAGNLADCEVGSTCDLADKRTAGGAIAVDAAGEAFFAGNTNAINLPVTLGAFAAMGLGAFVGKVKADGSGLSYLTYLGNAPPEAGTPPAIPLTIASAIAIDSAGNSYITGSTVDPNFPATAGAFQSAYGGPVYSNPFQQDPSDAFVAKLTPAGSALAWATYLGGTGGDGATSIALDASNNVWLAGITQSPNFPNASGWASGGDFLVELSSSGSTLPFSARYPNNTVSTAVALDGSGLVHSAGVDGIVSAFAPSALPAIEIYGIANAAAGYVTGRIVPGEVISFYGRNIGPAAPVTYSGTVVPANLGGVRVSIGGYPAPLLYVSEWQINAVVPVELQGPVSTVRIAFNASQSAPFATVVSPAEPAIFTNSSGIGVFNAGGSFVAGSVASMWVTGLDLSGFTNVADGQIPAAAGDLEFSGVQVLISVSPTEPPVPANILYEGLAPGLVDGIIQINFRVPASGFGPVTLAVGGRSSPPAE